ncbi:Uncharacterised protein [Mycobacteroides abscessus subsp. abscessus]|nr:Uncharacterised protein [Mycobacteroides abscessus subsp. abscessus]
MPSTPANTMHTSTSGAIDQNMSRPSWNKRGLAGLGAGTAMRSSGPGSPLASALPATPPILAGPHERITSHEPVAQRSP